MSATANTCERLIGPLLSRFVVIDVPEYSSEEFKEISIEILSKSNLDKGLAISIADELWNELGSRDFRDVVKVSRLSEHEEAVSFTVKMMLGKRKRQ